ncbi:MAG: sce7726 family protein [Acidobacteriota bacterium]
MRSPSPLTADADIRDALRSYLSVQYENEPDTVIFEELGICRGRVRIDVAAVNGLLHGYEIKSDRDTLRRLSDQVDFYSRVLDRATLVAGRSHLSKAAELVPDWWEVLLVTSDDCRLSFKAVREGRLNPSRDARSLVEFMWLGDAMNLLEGRGLARGARGKAQTLRLGQDLRASRLR